MVKRVLSKFRISYIFVIIIISVLVFCLGFTVNNKNNPIDVYKVYIDGEIIGTISDKEEFDAFIHKVNKSHFEVDESWYRWTYEHENIEKIAEKLVSRLENYPNYVFTSTDGNTWGHEPLKEGFAITDIEVNKRGAGGTIEELLITTDQGLFLVKNEYHVRAVITDGEAVANLQNDNTYACGNLLPSAFFIIDTVKNGERVIGIQVTGGGFGHGVGMSQNGAKNLANLGYNAKDILEFYYEGCEVRD